VTDVTVREEDKKEGVSGWSVTMSPTANKASHAETSEAIVLESTNSVTLPMVAESVRAYPDPADPDEVRSW
jgi:hypothetical protein